LAQAPPRRLRDRPAHARTPQYPNHDKILLRARDHAGERDVWRHGAKADEVRTRTELKGLNTIMSQAPFTKPRSPSRSGKSSDGVRSHPFDQWPEADRSAWIAARRPGERLKRGGPASHMKEITRHDLARRYGYFLDYVQRTKGLDPKAGAAAYVTPDRVEGYLAELQARVRSVTVYGSIYKLRRTTELLNPGADLAWLREIENDLALVMEPQSKFNRVVHTNVLVDAAMELMANVDAATQRSALARARQFRDGLMVALEALHLIRQKNFAVLEIGRSFRKVNGAWWIVLSASETKEGRADERPIVAYLNKWIDQYLSQHRPILARIPDPPPSLWLSSNDGKPLTYSAVEKIFSRTTLALVGVDVSPHLFRTAAASTAAIYAGDTPYLGSALLHHTDPTVAEEHYNRATGSSAAKSYAALIRSLRHRD
jgi:integrase